MTQPTAIVVDDEAIARQGLCVLLERDARLRVISSCGTVREAVQAIRCHQPAVVFLDIQMPGENGFELIHHLQSGPPSSTPSEHMPLVVFVTAFDQFALKAFEVNALDYLLKPFDQERLTVAVDRVLACLERQTRAQLQQSLLGLMQHLGESNATPTPPSDRLVVKDGGAVHFLAFDEIEWVGAAGNYVEIHTQQRTLLIRSTLHAMEAKLATTHFLRVAKSTIINLNALKRLTPTGHGTYVLQLRDGTQLHSSKTYRDRLAAIIR